MRADIGTAIKAYNDKRGKNMREYGKEESITFFVINELEGLEDDDGLLDGEPNPNDESSSFDNCIFLEADFNYGNYDTGNNKILDPMACALSNDRKPVRLEGRHAFYIAFYNRAICYKAIEQLGINRQAINSQEPVKIKVSNIIDLLSSLTPTKDNPTMSVKIIDVYERKELAQYYE